MKRIKLQNRDGRIAIQFSLKGKRYNIYGMGNFLSHKDRAKAELMVSVIMGDILEDNFDTSLERYKGSFGRALRQMESIPVMFVKWIESLDLSEQNYNIHYAPVHTALLQAEGNGSGDGCFTWYWQKLASRTYNDRLGVMKRFGEWLKTEGYMSQNPYRKMKTKPVDRTEIKPLTPPEVKGILLYLKNENPMVRAYYGFLLYTGCRPSEAIGLFKRKVDYEAKLITIDSVLARGDDGSSSAAYRVRKATKTGDIRKLPLTPELDGLLLDAYGYRAEHNIIGDLVFCDTQGRPLDDRYLCIRYWRPTLEALGIPYRKPYITRHTAASTVIENGGTLADAAKLLGHSDLRMVQTVYGHAIKDTVQPDYGEQPGI